MRSSCRALVLCCLLAPASATAGPAEPAELLCARGVARYQSGDFSGAAGLLRRVVAAAPENAAAGHHLGLALIRLGQLSEGRRALAAAARVAPEDRALLVDLGQAYLLEGNAAWAVRVLGRAVELEPVDRRAKYLHGVALLQLGQAEPAAETLRSARGGAGVDPADASLQLGLALYRSGHYEEGRLALGPALGGPETRGVARRLVRASLGAEGRPAALISAEVSLGAVVDSNPLYEHEKTGATAVGPAVAGSLVLRPVVTSRHAVWGEVAATRSFYLPAETQPPGSSVEDASPSEIRAGAFYGLRLGDSRSALELSGGYSFDLTLLDGPPPLADQHHIFLEQHSGQLAVLRRRGRNHSQLRYSLMRSQFADLARSNWGNELAFEQALSLQRERLRVLGWVGIRYETAESPDYNQVVPGLGLGGSYLGPLGLVLGLRLGYEYRSHVDSGGSLRWTDQRIDHNVAFTVELGRALPWNLRLRAVYQRLQNLSTVTTYEFSRDLFSLGLSWSSP